MIERRGILKDPSIKERAEKFFGCKIEDKAIPSLLVYLHYCLVNSQAVKIGCISHLDFENLQAWNDKGWICLVDDGTSALSVSLKSKEFYDVMCMCIYDAYVDKV